MKARGAPARLVGAAALTAAALAGLAALSQAPYQHADARRAELRLSWRARSAPVEACRQRSAEELARVPVHMRHDLACERGVVPYRLEVALGDSTVVDRVVAAAGARADRPLYVFTVLPLDPGTYRLRVVFSRQGGVASPDADDRVDDPRVAPPRLALDTTVVLAAGRAALVNYDEDTRRLTLVTEQ